MSRFERQARRGHRLVDVQGRPIILGAELDAADQARRLERAVAIADWLEGFAGELTPDEIRTAARDLRGVCQGAPLTEALERARVGPIENPGPN